jgi:hypothetical protein
MLRITPSDEPTGLALHLEGKLVGQWVELLRSAATGAHTLDLAHVTFVDPDGLRLLHDVQRQGVRLRHASGFISELLRADTANRAHP